MEITNATLATSALLVITTVFVLWLLDDRKVPPPLLDEDLLPKTPEPDEHHAPISIARTILEAYLTQSRETLGDAGTAALSPIHVSSAYLPNWLTNKIPLRHPVSGWTISYEGGAWATAVSKDGVHIQLDATARQRPGRKTTICAVLYGAQRMRLIDVPARTKTATSHYKTAGWGRFRHYVTATGNTAKAKTIITNFQYLDTQRR